MRTLDLRKQWKHLYAPSAKTVEAVDVPAFNFVMIDGQIEPGQLPGASQAFQEAVAALYGAAYTLKFMSKLRKQDPVDYPVMALEGVWWSEAGEFDLARPDAWRWTLMIMQPEHVDQAMFAEALRQLEKKKPSPALARLRLESFLEGLSLQIMHIGPYATELASVEKLRAFAQEQGYRLRGKHHEIYLGDPRKASPDKLKTVLRQPVELDIGRRTL